MDITNGSRQIIIIIISFTVTSTEGLTATCAAAFELSLLLKILPDKLNKDCQPEDMVKIYGR